MTLVRRNVVGALAGSAALAVIAATQLWPDWAHYRATVVPDRTVAGGESARADGQDWQVRNAYRSPGRDGVAQLIVTLSHSGEDPGRPWQAVATDGSRRWSTVAPISFAGPMRLVFDIPAAAEPTAVDLVRPDGEIALRLLL